MAKRKIVKEITKNYIPTDEVLTDNILTYQIPTKEITYSEYGIMLSSLCRKIQEKENITAVYGLARGGLAIAVHVSHYFKIPLIESIIQIEPLYKNKQILVVDDIMTNGRTFSRFIEFANLRHINYKTAVLCYKENYFKPDYWEYEAKADEHIIFPWELKS